MPDAVRECPLDYHPCAEAACDDRCTLPWFHTERERDIEASRRNGRSDASGPQVQSERTSNE